MQQVKVREYSDIHLDHYKLGKLWYPPVLPDDAETILILAGDLWIGTRFIEWEDISHETTLLKPEDLRPSEVERGTWIEKVACRFKQVLIVLGNHDYWPINHGSLTIRRGGEKCNELLADRGLHNVKVLDCDTYVDGDFLFIGCTLWTDMNKRAPLSMMNMNRVMAYDGKIAYETGPNGQWDKFTSGRWVHTHSKHREYIRLVAKQNPDKTVVVITHHLPMFSLCDPRYKGDSSNCYYASDLSDLIMDNPNIKNWFYGHTHYQDTAVFGECVLINNCIGYSGEMNEARGLVKHETLVLSS